MGSPPLPRSPPSRSKLQRRVRILDDGAVALFREGRVDDRHPVAVAGPVGARAALETNLQSCLQQMTSKYPSLCPKTVHPKRWIAPAMMMMVRRHPPAKILPVN